jgi:3-hydroxyisobutyrate dehydrogenase
MSTSPPDPVLDLPGAIGFVGLGKMGSPMASRLAAAGASLAIHDARADLTESVASRIGATACTDPAAIGAAADFVITMLPDGAAVADAVLGEGVASGIQPGGLIVDMSTAAPAQTRELGARLTEMNIRLVDAPVSGGVARAETGELTIIAGGEQADVRACAGVFASLGSQFFHAGPLGAGHAAKALNNAVSAAGLIAAGEALIVADRAGIEPATMLEVLNASSGRNNSTENKIGQFVFTGSFASGFALRLLAKDLAIAEDLAADLEVAPQLLHESSRIAAAADRALGPEADHTEVVRWLEQHANEASTAPTEMRGADAFER